MKENHSAHYMGNQNYRGYGSASIAIIAILLMSNLSLLVHSEMDDSVGLSPSSNFYLSSKASGGDVDAPSWRVGDSWVYDGFFDVAALIASSGQSSNIQTLTGDLDMWIADIITMTTENQSTLVYKVRSSGEFRANGVTLSGFTGDIIVDYEGTDYVRVSDLATISMQMNLDVLFDHWLTDIDIANLQVINSYSPPREEYDFPLRVGEAWHNNFTQTTDWSGSSDYFTIPDDSTTQSSSNHAVVAQGNPNVPYSGCSSSFNVTTFDSSGLNVSSYRWWCANAMNDAHRHFQDDIGFEIDFKLKSFSPQTRSINLDVELESPAWILDAPLGAWVNVTNSAGSAVSGQALQWRYEASGVSHSLTTASNGSAYIGFNTGNATDPSPTNFDWASHGIIAWVASSKEVGVDTFTLDDSIITLDYSPNSGGVSVERTRDGNTVILNPTIGYNAVPGDSLIFSIPVENLGILPGPATELMVTGPDGTTSRTSVATISALGTAWVQATWVVPSSQSVGVVTLSFEVDPDGLMTGDQNQSNDVDTFDMFIGTLPTAVLIQPPATKTLTNIHLDGRNSVDLDGGSPFCIFVVEISPAVNETFEEEDCLLENRSWSDDGTYRVWLTVTDDENDLDSTIIDVEILNRAPWVNVSSQGSVLSIPVESSVIFFATDSGDLDTLNNDAPVDFLWQLPVRSDGQPYACESGVQVSPTCEVTPMEEGIFTTVVSVEDDDGAVTTGDFNLVVTNIAPSDSQITMWNGSTEITDDRNPPIWDINEDQVVTLKGTAHDSLNDMDSLTWGWQPDLDVDPSWYVETVGETSEIEVSWSTTGTHVVAMETVDDDGESSGIVNGWVRISNVAPTVEQFDPLLPVGEDRELSLTGVYNDTASDLDSLRVCWDVDFEVDLDSNGDSMDDCDFVGADITHYWSDAGEKMLRFHVTDDDGDTAEAIVNVTVANLKPKAAATAEKLEVQVGEELVIWTNETTDSASDMSQLIFSWDLDTSKDSDDDGDPTNDLDVITLVNEPLRHAFASEGTKNIRLTVSDESLSSVVDLTVTVSPDDTGVLGWIESSSAGVSNIVVILGLVLVVLLMVLGISMVRNKAGRPNEDWLGGAVFEETSPTLAPPTYAFDQMQAATSEAPPALMPEATEAVSSPPALMTEEPLLTPQPEPLQSSQAPPLPATGLPEGWTMEQWGYYGAQWLIDNPTPPVDTGLDWDL